jgi:hypothetical protein
VERLKDVGMGGVDIRFVTTECNMCPAVVEKIFSLSGTTKEFALMKYNLKFTPFQGM